MKEFGYTVPQRDSSGEIVSTKNKVISLATKGTLSAFHGKDKEKKLVVALKVGDIIEFRPLHSRRCYSVSAFDVYNWVVRRYAQHAFLEKARVRKEVLKLRREKQAIKRKEKQLFT